MTILKVDSKILTVFEE